MVGKTLQDYLNEDPSLTEKVTLEEIENPKSGFDDSEVESVFYTYKQVLENSR